MNNHEQRLQKGGGAGGYYENRIDSVVPLCEEVVMLKRFAASKKKLGTKEHPFYKAFLRVGGSELDNGIALWYEYTGMCV